MMLCPVVKGKGPIRHCVQPTGADQGLYECLCIAWPVGRRGDVVMVPAGQDPIRAIQGSGQPKIDQVAGLIGANDPVELGPFTVAAKRYRNSNVRYLILSK